jgi:single-stranded-DNA-specific exonuclease
MFKQAKALVEENAVWQTHSALVLAHADWHPGVIGIVASRVAEHFHKPAIMIALDDRPGGVSGSGRSLHGFDLHAALCECRARLVTCGGHHAAAGLKILPTEIEAFRDEFVEIVSRNMATSQVAGPMLDVDSEVRLADITRAAVYELEKLGPFGAANKRPVFVVTGVELAGTPRRIGEGERHLSLMVRQYGTSLRGVAFGKGEWADEMTQVNGPLSLCLQPVINRFRGEEKVEFQLLDWKPSTSVTTVNEDVQHVGV